MDLVNDLSSDVALALIVEGELKQKLGARDAKSFIAHVEAELSRIYRDNVDHAEHAAGSADLSH